MRKKNQQHGMSNTPEYKTWASMVHRCTNEKVPSYKYYGGRGIGVCERWLDFLSFYEDMGDRPDGMTLDRIDNNGDYEPENCRWATRKQQAKNKRPKKQATLTHNGESLTVKQWAERLGVKPSTIHQRIKSGWPIEKTLSTPAERFPTIQSLIEHYSQ